MSRDNQRRSNSGKSRRNNKRQNQKPVEQETAKIEQETAQTENAEEVKAAASEPENKKPDTSVNEQQGEKKTMSETNTSSENNEAKKANKTAKTMPVVAAQAPQKSGSGMAGVLGVLAFFMSAAAGYGVYWNWQQLQEERNVSTANVKQLEQQIVSEISKNSSALKSEVSSIVEQKTAAIQQEVASKQSAIQSTLDSKTQEIQTLAQQIQNATSEKIATAEANLTQAQADLGAAKHGIAETQKKQESLEVSIDGLYARLGNTSKEWVIAEADYLLKVANHRLQLEEDVTTAIQALTLADKRLNSLDDPALNEVRNVIAQELVSLQTLPIPDQTGIALQLTELQDKVNQLPLNARTQPTNKNTKPFEAGDAPQIEGWAAVPGAVMETLKGLVVVSYNDKPIEPLLSPEQIANLHENLKLKLEQARIVLFRGNQKEFESNMELALDWTQKHFNTEEVSTKKFIDTLNYLKGKQIDLKVPDISSSLRSLRSVSKRMELNIPNMDANAKVDSELPNVAMK